MQIAHCSWFLKIRLNKSQYKIKGFSTIPFLAGKSMVLFGPSLKNMSTLSLTS